MEENFENNQTETNLEETTNESNNNSISQTQENKTEVTENTQPLTESVEVKKDGRGVKPGTKRGSYKKKSDPIQSEIKIEQKIETGKDDSNKMESWMNEYQTVPNENDVKEAKERIENEHQSQIQEKEKVEIDKNEEVLREANAQLINGGMLLAVCDFFFPMLFKFIHKHFLKNKYTHLVKTKDVILTPDQVEQLEPISDAAAQIIFAKVHPIVLFVIAMGMSYGTNYKLALDDAEERELKRLKAEGKSDPDTKETKKENKK